MHHIQCNREEQYAAKTIARRHATVTERFTVAFLSSVVISEVSEMKVISPATGFTITNIDANA
jgi:hypothetical protein